MLLIVPLRASAEHLYLAVQNQFGKYTPVYQLDSVRNIVKKRINLNRTVRSDADTCTNGTCSKDKDSDKTQHLLT